MARSAASTAREAVRARSSVKKLGRRSESEQGCLTGHPAFGTLVPAFEMEVMPEGGGYPESYITRVGELMGVTNYAEILHICSGSVRSARSLDWRQPEGRLGCPDADVFTPMLEWRTVAPAEGADTAAAAAASAGPSARAHLVGCAHNPPHARLGGSSCSVVGDARRLPFRDASVRWIMADPPYAVDYAETLWGLGKRYPTPIHLLREAARVLAPGGLVAFLHHLYPILPADGEGRPLLKKVSVHGILTGPGYRIRALTICRRTGVPVSLFDYEGDEQ